MNEIVNKFLLAGDKFMPEMHLKELGFTYSACGPFTKNKEKIQKFMLAGNTDYIYKNNLDKDKAFRIEIKLLKLHVIQNMIDIKED